MNLSRQWRRSSGLPFHLKRSRCAADEVGRGQRQSGSAGARGALSFFCREWSEIARLGKVATAHTRDDQAETVMMWFLRGAGMKGIGWHVAAATTSTSQRLDRIR